MAGGTANLKEDAVGFQVIMSIWNQNIGPMIAPRKRGVYVTLIYATCSPSNQLKSRRGDM